MPDIVDPATRSRMMSGIRGKDTAPEMLIRKGLHARGFRYRLHPARVPGKPDIVLPRYRTAIFVHGCFWHFHDCHLFRMPSTRTAFWEKKLHGNRRRDAEVRTALQTAGWRVLVVWECAIKGKYRLDPEELLRRIAAWIRSDRRKSEIAGKAA